MSCYEGMNGKGLVKKMEIKELKKKLIEAHNNQIAQFKPSELKKMNIAKASSHTDSFPILRQYGNELCKIGYIQINTNEGTFHFQISENNHAVEHAQDCSLSFNALMKFMRNLDEKGNKYGAESYYWNEYQEDEYGHQTPGDKEYYGAWKPVWEKPRRRRRIV